MRHLARARPRYAHHAQYAQYAHCTRKQVLNCDGCIAQAGKVATW